MTPHRRALLAWLIVGATGLLLLPWYALQDTVLGVAWLRDWAQQRQRAGAAAGASARTRLAAPAGACCWPPQRRCWRPRLERAARANGLIAIGAAGFAWVLVQGFAIGPAGWSFAVLTDVFGPLSGRQYGMGLGALPHRHRFRDDPVAGSRRARLLQRRRLRRRHRGGSRRPHRRVHVLSGRQDPRAGHPGQRWRIRALPRSPARLFTEKIWGLALHCRHRRAAASPGTRCCWQWRARSAARRWVLHSRWSSRARNSGTRNSCACCRCCRSSRRRSSSAWD